MALYCLEILLVPTFVALAVIGCIYLYSDLINRNAAKTNA